MPMSTTIFKWIFIVVCIFDYHTLYADITFVDNEQQHVSEVETPPSHFKDKQQLEVNARYGEADVAEHEDLKRLPNVLEPKEYYIRIKPYFPYPAIQYPQERNMTFDGVTTFIFKVKNATSVFVLHAHNLVFDHVEFTDSNGIPIGVKSTTVNATLDHVTVEPAVVPTVGETYLLQFKYRGIINSYELGGLFYTYYDDIQQTRHWMVATHMETGVHARSLFPCLDEPAYKAIFHMTIIYPKPLIALSNMMERPYVELHDPWVVVRFPPTPKLSTYLVAMAVGPYVSKSITNKAGTLVRSWGWTGQEEYLGFAATVAGKCLDSLGEYVNFPFPLSKSDQLGLPKFPAGAVENMGLVIYKYQYIQFNEQLQSIQVKQKAAGVICHELAHQWFGDLVTMTWWPELVVNEGFANYFEIYNQAMAFPEHAQFLDGKFFTDMMEPALDTDAIINASHPIIARGLNFDKIVYDKGASIYRMAHITLGDEAWQEGLTDYIHSYKWGNANHEMLFAKLTKAAQAHNIVDWCGRPMDVAKFLDPWFLQQCFPLITVTNNQLMAPAQFTQQPFDKRTLLPPSNFSYSWPVPMHIRDYKGDHKSILHWLKPGYDQCGGVSRAVTGTQQFLPHQKQQQAAPSNKAYSSPNQFAVHWELGNSGMVAFARTQYDDIGYSRLVEDLRKGSTDYYSMADRVAILGDEIALLRRRQAEGKPFSYNRIVELMTLSLSSYPHFAPFKICQPLIDELERFFIDGLDFDLFQRFISKLLLKNYEILGWTPTEDWDSNMARYLMFPYASRNEVGDSKDAAKKLFDTMMQDCAETTTGVEKCSHIPPDVREGVYCSAIKFGPQANFDFLLKLYHQQVKYQYYFYQEYHAMLAGLACTTSKENLNGLIPVVLSANTPEAAYRPLMYLTRNPIASDVMMEYIRSNAKQVLESGQIDLYLQSMTATWQTQTRLDQFIQLCSDLERGDPQVPASVCAPHIASLRAQVSRAQRYLPDIVHIFYDRFVKEGDDPWDERLPRSLMPLKYNAFIQPYFPSSGAYPWYKNMTFDSVVDMTIKVVEPTDMVNISLHRMFFHPSDVVLKDSNQKLIECSKIVKDYDNGVITIYLTSTLTANAIFSLHIQSIGFIFYGSNDGVYTNFNYYEFNGKMAWILSTDMESGPGIRSLVPCFDEPFFKAKWQLKVKHAADMKVLTNTIHTNILIERNETEPGWAITSFGETPPMSSYLLALSIGHYDSMQKISKTGVLVRAWSWTGMETYAEMGLNFAAGTLEYMANYLNTSFTMPKLDLVSVPQYTGSSRAMENWGVIIMIYEALLIDPLYATTLEYSIVARVTPHEVVHQWFGDLVTTEWWSTLFLNEAFAQYYYTDAANYTYPDQQKYAKFVRFWLADYALLHDGRIDETKPIITNRKPMFTYAPYYKGASVLYMLNNAVGFSVMRDGLRAYFKANAFKTTTEKILWAAITKAAADNHLMGWDNNPLDVQALMDPWTKQENYPILKLTTSNDVVTYSQEPFISNLSALAQSQWHYQWPIPVHSITETGHEFRYFTADQHWTRNLGTGWRVENPGSVGMYRVWYDESTWAPIRAQFRTDFNAFDEVTRAQFISDAIALRERGSLPWSRVIAFASYLSKETEFAPHYAFKSVRDQLMSAFKNTADTPKINKYIQRTFETAYDIGWANNTDWTMAALATLATDGMCKTALPECLEKTKTLFEEFLTNCQYSTTGTGLCNSEVRPDVRRTQYCYGLAQTPTGHELVKRLYDWFKTNSHYFHRDADNLLNAMACTTDDDKMNSFISDIVEGKYPESALHMVAVHDTTDHVLWNYFKLNTEQVIYGVPSFNSYMTAAVGTWNQAENIKEMDDFIAGIELSGDNLAVLNELKKKIQQNIDWLAKNRDDIMTAIEQELQ